MKFKLFLFSFLLFCFIFPTATFAAVLSIDEGFFNDGYQGDNKPFMGTAQGYCIHKYDRLDEGKIYQCQNVRKVYYAISTVENIQPASANTNLKFSCWRTMYDSGNSGYTGGNYQPINPLILNQSYEFSRDKPTDYNFFKPCKPKIVAVGQTCNVDTKQIVQTAFAQKFPLDLFIGVQQFSSPLTCPNFTLRGQTFQLCYLTKLVASLKYVLLLVFIISSLIAL